MCSRCLNEHDKFDAMKGHHIIDKAMSIRGHIALPTQMCDDHSSKLVDMFCPQHDRVCCSACIAIHHRLCEEINYIPSISTGTKTSPEIQDVLKDNKATLAELQQRKNERENDKKRIADEKKAAEKSVQESAQNIIKSVNDLKQKSLNHIQQKFNEFHQKIDEDCKKINDAITALEADVKRNSMRIQPDQKECAILGICPMPDETILVTDMENEKLKCLDKSYNHIDHCQLPGRPTSICRTGPTEVAITLTKQQMIQFVSVPDTLTPTSSFHVGENCRGIAYSRGQLFVTCGGAREFNERPGEVRIYSTDGKLLHKLPQQSTGQQVWSCPMRIALTQNGIKMIMTDQKHGVVTMDRDGSNMNKNPLNAGDLCVQDQSLWFVYGNTTKIIYQVNNDGSSLGALLTEDDGIDELPYSVCYQRDGERLVVGFKDCDHIKVFQLYRK